MSSRMCLIQNSRPSKRVREQGLWANAHVWGSSGRIVWATRFRLDGKTWILIRFIVRR